MKKTHEDERLNSLIGKRVELTFFDGDIEEGILSRSRYHLKYCLERIGEGDLCFYKSHVKKVKEVILNDCS